MRNNKCNIVLRWWHQRLRNYDTLMLLPSFQLVVMTKHPEAEPEKRDKLVDLMFEVHKLLPGNEHWICSCSE